MDLKIRVARSVKEIDADVWNAFANPAARPYHPFVDHAFFSALEASGSAARSTGWLGQHLVLEDAGGAIRALMPCYVKSHSQGEYVFDHSWADAYERAGGRYYPKLQASVPFTPVTGPRLLVGEGVDGDTCRRALLAGARQICATLGVSSVHVTFMSEGEWTAAAGEGFLQRTDTQFHWMNEGYATFEDFLARLSSGKRKNIRKERENVRKLGLTFERLSGADIREHHWDAFFEFYMETGSRKWGSPYLTRRFFSLVGASMSQRVLLILCRRNGRYVAGALNFVGDDAVYGRNWGATEHHPFLHFETCYYQAIDFAIEHRLARVEAGAQGPHKLARGYLPQLTYSAHHFSDPRLGRAVAEYLKHERDAVAEDQDMLGEHSPFRHKS